MRRSARCRGHLESGRRLFGIGEGLLHGVDVLKWMNPIASQSGRRVIQISDENKQTEDGRLLPGGFNLFFF